MLGSSCTGEAAVYVARPLEMLDGLLNVPTAAGIVDAPPVGVPSCSETVPVWPLSLLNAMVMLFNV